MRTAVLRITRSTLLTKDAYSVVSLNFRFGHVSFFYTQPTLHKPGIMAHYVRVLHSPTQKTIRMHYTSEFIEGVKGFIKSFLRSYVAPFDTTQIATLTTLTLTVRAKGPLFL